LPPPFPSAIAISVVVLHRAVAIAIIVNVICARCAAEGGIVVVIVRCLSAYPASSLPVPLIILTPIFLIVT
jgi:hypothetical protein